MRWPGWRTEGGRGRLLCQPLASPISHLELKSHSSETPVSAKTPRKPAHGDVRACNPSTLGG